MKSMKLGTTIFLERPYWVAVLLVVPAGIMRRCKAIPCEGVGRAYGIKNSGARIRTSTEGSKVPCPTIRRPPNDPNTPEWVLFVYARILAQRRLWGKFNGRLGGWKIGRLVDWEIGKSGNSGAYQSTNLLTFQFSKSGLTNHISHDIILTEYPTPRGEG